MTETEHRLWWSEKTDVTYGECWCGCGQRSRLAGKDDVRRDAWKGFPTKFIKSHRLRTRVADEKGNLQCTHCGEMKPEGEFRWVGVQIAGKSRNSHCKVCDSILSNNNYQKNKQRARERYFRLTYGLTFEDINKMLDYQAHMCKICGGDFSKIKYVVDHCHSTGKVRGLLCNTCNNALGGFRDSPEILESAVRYLEEQNRVM